MTDSNSTLIRAMVVLGGLVIVAIVALVVWGPEDKTVLTYTITTIVTVVTLLTTNLLTLKVSAEGKATAEQAVRAATDSRVTSEKNAVALKEVAATQVEQGEVQNQTHQIVNSQRTAMEQKIDALNARIEDVTARLAAVTAVSGERADVAEAAAPHE
jgi:hypothetical protein